MKREIKFRAWDTQEKEMITSGHLGAGSGAQLIVIEFQGGITLANAYGLMDGTNPTFNEPVTDRLKLMQYTGLKDKNGKEIYEGDIIKGCNGSINGHPWHIGPREIKWLNNKAEFNVPLWGTLENQNSTHWFEVIGNIYENPELLK